MYALANYFWRLIPGNPILLRVVAGGGKRKRDLAFRCAYLGLLVFLVIILLVQSAGNENSLAQLTERSGQIFWWMSHVQLGLVALLAPIFTAAAITQERDSQTYDILLSTPLTNGQIVLGSLLSRMFFVFTLLISGIPVFSVTQIFGGVAIRSIVQSFLIAAATAFVTGALAIAIAVFKVGTRRTIFSFYLLVMLFLAVPVAIEAVAEAGRAPGQLGFLQLAGSKPGSHISWLTGMNPFLALRVIFNSSTYVAPEAGSALVTSQPWPIGWYLSSPHTFYITFMFTAGLVLIAPSTLVLRRLAQSTTSLRWYILQKLHLHSGNRTRKPRRVWANPIAWREARTKASAARAVILRYFFMGGGLAAAVALLVIYGGVGTVDLSKGVYIGASGVTFNNEYRSGNAASQVSLLDHGNPKTLRLDPSTPVRCDGTPADMGALRPYVKVVSYSANGSNITAISVVSGGVSDDKRAMGRRFLLGLVLVEFAMILLIVTQSAASTVSREREDGTLDLLLSTPITSRYYIWGKLRGLVSFALPLLAIPVVSMALFVVRELPGWWRSPAPEYPWMVYPEAVVLLPAAMVMASALAAIVGMHMSLRCRTTMVAVMSSVGIVAAVCLGAGMCGLGALNASGDLGPVGPAVASLSPFSLAGVLIDPADLVRQNPRSGMDMSALRVAVFITTLVALGVYAAIVASMYRSMVRNFDMTIRKQSQ